MKNKNMIWSVRVMMTKEEYNKIVALQTSLVPGLTLNVSQVVRKILADVK